MHKEILTENQIKLLPLISKFKNDFYLVGGTAIALQIGHRESIDFDMFTFGEFDNSKLKQKIKRYGKIDKILRDELGNLTFFSNKVQITFFDYPYKIKPDLIFEDILMMPDLLVLGAMKFLALGHRAKWKDYVDLYFILRDFHSLQEIIKKAKEIFGSEINEKILREQLAYFNDINYNEKVVYKPGFEVSDEEIKKKLIKFSLS